jgi:hypothetical protein
MLTFQSTWLKDWAESNCSLDCFCILVNRQEERKELGIISEEEFE